MFGISNLARSAGRNKSSKRSSRTGIVEATDVWFESGFVCLGIKRLEYPYVKTVKVLPAHRVKGITKIDGQNPG